MKSFMFYCIIIIIICLMTFWMVEGQRGCYTPKNTKGECIGVEECGPISAILHNKSRTRNDTTYLRDSTCGFENRKPKVCCEKLQKREETCITSDQRIGLCISLFNCPSLLAAFKAERKLPEQSTCGGSPPIVCCKDNIFILSTSRREKLPRRTECGFQAKIRNLEDIQNGHTHIDEYPWVAHLEYRDKKNNSTTLVRACTATLISSKYLLSTANCATNENYEIKNVILSEYDLRTDVDCEITNENIVCNDDLLRISVKNFIAHPDYFGGQFLYDISLIEMSESVQFTNFIRPICLPQMNILEDEEIPAQRLLATGWYMVYDEHIKNKADIKLNINVPHVAQSECKSVFKQRNIDIVNEHICAGGEPHRCLSSKDGGVPLMRLRNGQFEILGIFSFGSKRCNTGSNVPQGFTNVYSYMDWIIANIK